MNSQALENLTPLAQLKNELIKRARKVYRNTPVMTPSEYASTNMEYLEWSRKIRAVQTITLANNLSNELDTRLLEIQR